MKAQTQLKSNNAHDNSFVLAARNLWPVGFIFAGTVGILISFSWVWSR